MALTIEWDSGLFEGHGRDIHVVRGTTSPPLDEAVIVEDGSGAEHTAREVNAAGSSLDVTFNARFSGTPGGPAHGILVSSSDGSVDATAPAPDGPRLRNFLIDIVVTDWATGEMEGMLVRVHIHEGIMRMWATPSTLHVHEGARWIKPSLLAWFTDGSDGDITHWAGVRWTSSDPSVVDIDRYGEIEAKRAGGQATLTPSVAAIAGLEDPPAVEPCEVTVLPPWSEGAELTFIDGPGEDLWADAVNILILPEGYTEDQLDRFEALTRSLVQALRVREDSRPFNLLEHRINYWMARVPSPRAGVTHLAELGAAVDERGEGREDDSILYEEIPFPRRPGIGDSWSLEEMIYQVGLPVLEDDRGDVEFEGDDGKLAVWRALYGEHAVDADKLRANFAAWLELAHRILPNEIDSAFGLTVGERPRAEEYRPARRIADHPGRLCDDDLEEFLRNLRRPDGTVAPVAECWVTDASGNTRGKDYGYVGFLCAGQRWAGTNSGLFFALNLGTSRDRRVSPRDDMNGSDLTPLNEDELITAVSAKVHATFMHELGHSLNLADEYGGGGRAPEDKDFSGDLNIQEETGPRGVRRDDGQLDVRRIKWLWPRIDVVGITMDQPAGEGVSRLRVALRPGEASAFTEGDRVLLRTRPLVDALTSPVLLVDEVDGDDVVLNTRSADVPGGEFPGGSVLIRPHFSADEPDRMLELVAPSIQDHLERTDLPLNAPANATVESHVCDPTDDWYQQATNRPADDQLDNPPRVSHWLAGLYEGGHTYDCGVYHAFAYCNMRNSSFRHDGERIVCRFCPICGYVMVDLIDPTAHPAHDAVFAPHYPDR